MSRTTAAQKQMAMIEIVPPSDAAVLFTAVDAAAMFHVSERTWRSWDSGGHVPRPIAISRSKYWRPKELYAWAKSGCPRRALWDSMSEGQDFS